LSTVWKKSLDCPKNARAGASAFLKLERSYSLLSATDEKSNRGESSEENSARFRHGIESELVGSRSSTRKGASILFEHDFKAELLLGICFWRKVREERVWAEYMGEKGGGVNRTFRERRAGPNQISLNPEDDTGIRMGGSLGRLHSGSLLT